MYPSYLTLYKDGMLAGRADKAFGLLESCSLCPRRCGVNRLKNEKGFCRTGSLARVYSYMPHFGEEPPISGRRGSGTIFFSGCNMSCVYCQNYEFSQSNAGREVEPSELAQFMLELQESGCHNINFVTPTHVLPQILQALCLAIPQGFNLPLVYNTGGYDLPDIIRILDGIVDIFLPDMRYAEGELSIKYSSAPDYPEHNQAAVKQMHRQAGDAEINEQGLIVKGLIIRHLVLPGDIAGTEKIMRFIAREISPQTYISLMSQYFPCHKAGEYPGLSRRVSRQEYARAQEIMSESGLFNGWLQEPGGPAHFAGTNIRPI